MPRYPLSKIFLTIFFFATQVDCSWKEFTCGHISRRERLIAADDMDPTKLPPEFFEYDDTSFEERVSNLVVFTQYFLCLMYTIFLFIKFTRLQRSRTIELSYPKSYYFIFLMFAIFCLVRIIYFSDAFNSTCFPGPQIHFIPIKIYLLMSFASIGLLAGLCLLFAWIWVGIKDALLDEHSKCTIFTIKLGMVVTFLLMFTSFCLVFFFERYTDVSLFIICVSVWSSGIVTYCGISFHQGLSTKFTGTYFGKIKFAVVMCVICYFSRICFDVFKFHEKTFLAKMRMDSASDGNYWYGLFFVGVVNLNEILPAAVLLYIYQLIMVDKMAFRAKGHQIQEEVIIQRMNHFNSFITEKDYASKRGTLKERIMGSQGGNNSANRFSGNSRYFGSIAPKLPNSFFNNNINIIQEAGDDQEEKNSEKFEKNPVVIYEQSFHSNSGHHEDIYFTVRAQQGSNRGIMDLERFKQTQCSQMKSQQTLDNPKKISQFSPGKKNQGQDDQLRKGSCNVSDLQTTVPLTNLTLSRQMTDKDFVSANDK